VRVGAAGVIAALGSLARQTYWILGAAGFLEFIVCFGFAAALIAVYLLDRTETVYLWFALAYFVLALGELVSFALAAPGIPVETENLNSVLGACYVAFLITAWWQWFQLQERRWLIRLVWIAVLIRLIAEAGSLPPLLGTAVPLGWASMLQVALTTARLSIGLLFIVIVVFGIQRQGREGWLALPAVLLFCISFFHTELEHLHIPDAWTTFGVRISLDQIADIGLSAVLGVLILRRFQRSQQRKQQLEADLRQAQQVQHVLLPEAIPAVPGFHIECEYRPAQEVGGDFFQVLETRDGGVLVVIGDVSGKGVRAAMLVALIVGTLRTAAEETEEPQKILERLNRRLVGRMEGGLVTCSCAHINPDGSLTIANAGHLAPWLDGQEMEVPHDLPLGISEEIEYSERHLQIPENSTLTFVSDGVVEAKNGHKELFGFDRVRAVSTQSAARIADAAKQFGQEDDITVVTIQRLRVAIYAA
jgi:Stage II sporulation protein E (SpoIIE)